MTDKKHSDFQEYWKKPIPIKAKQMQKAFEVKTLEGTMKGKAGDFLAIGVNGEQYPIDKEIFEKTYSDKPTLSEEKHQKLLNNLKGSLEMAKYHRTEAEREASFLKEKQEENISIERLEQFCKSEEGKALQEAKKYFQKAEESKTKFEKRTNLDLEAKADGMAKAFKFILKNAKKEAKKSTITKKYTGLK